MTSTQPPAIACTTRAGRPAFVVNIEVFLERDGRWLLIRRGAREAHAPGTLAGVGGKVEAGDAGADVFERTARREVAEETGVDLTGAALTYARSSYFVTDDGDPVLNVVFRGRLPAAAEPAAASEEVAGLVWLTLAEAEAHPNCPPWVRETLRHLASGQARP
ncbi:NUDIX hydrolase [Sphaerisporangium aureirubrum]|uniref:NUDIX hydrolase n=1 Tax=Sphaerisporangium aureirubrum TaxID=1544736 RepID=A0ABW1N9X8_9ACTN